MLFFHSVKTSKETVNVSGQDYGALTVAAPDDAVYGTEGEFITGLFGQNNEINNSGMADLIWTSNDLATFGMNVPDLIEDNTLTPPPGLPPLSPGWSYRSFRLSTPVSSLPGHSFQVKIFADEDDLEDLPPKVRKAKEARGRKHHARLEELGAIKDAMHGYLASMSYADAMLGRLLDAIESGPNAENTIVVMWSDHGYHLGEKNRFPLV